MSENIKQNIEQLSHRLEEHNHKYYILDHPNISDKEYDDLYQSLVALEKKYPEYLDKNSPTQRVGSKISSPAQNIKHRKLMLSLDNTYSLDDLKAWHQRVLKGLEKKTVEYIVELKIDGVSASLSYDQGDLSLAATRGDGEFGEDVTHNIRTIKTIPLKLKNIKDKNKRPSLLDVRGEVYMNKKTFQSLNVLRKDREEVLFANPRNAASGSLKLLDARVADQRHLDCYVHSFGVIEGGEFFNTMGEFFSCVQGWGLCVNPHNRLCLTIEDVMDFCLEFQERRDQLPYDVDGVVIKVNDLHDQELLGETAKSPRWAVSYKFPALQVTTVVKNIVVQMGRTGVMTPVADLESVKCGGVVISRATLHNFDEVQRLGIKVGDKVLVERAGDVIPKIVKVIASTQDENREVFQAPTNCPACGELIVKDADNVAYRCLNVSCPKQVEMRVIHFSSRGGMDIEGMGSAVVSQLLKEKIIQDIGDIYFIQKKDLLDLDFFAEKKADKLIQAIEKSKTQSLSKLVFALGIKNVGEKIAMIVSQKFKTLSNISQLKVEDLQSVNEIGDVIAESLVYFMHLDSTKKLFEKLVQAGVNMLEEENFEVDAGHVFFEKTFVFTGEMNHLTRGQAKNMVQSLGGKVITSVSKKTNYIVVGGNPGSKYKKALDLGVSILTENQFEEMMHEK